jgi:hypothetical protein
MHVLRQTSHDGNQVRLRFPKTENNMPVTPNNRHTRVRELQIRPLPVVDTGEPIRRRFGRPIQHFCPWYQTTDNHLGIRVIRDLLFQEGTRKHICRRMRDMIDNDNGYDSPYSNPYIHPLSVEPQI